VLKTTVDKMHS